MRKMGLFHFDGNTNRKLYVKARQFLLMYDFPFPLSFLSFLSHTHLKRSQILSLVFRHRLCLNTFMGILVIHWIAPKRQLIVVYSFKDWSVFLSMYIYVRQGGGSCPPVLMYKLMYISCLLTVTHQYVTYWKYKQWDVHWCCTREIISLHPLQFC